MDKAEFEKRFLNLVYQTNTVITAPNVAYQLSIPIEEAQEHLLSLELNGTLQQATDPQGNTYYTMPNRPAPGALAPGGGLQPETGGNGGGRPPGVFNPADLPAAPLYANPGAKPMNINGLVLNVIFPGLGSLVCGRSVGLAMMGLVLLGIVLFLLPLGFGRLIGAIPIICAWAWSIMAGVKLMGERAAGPGVPG